jgi:hypothetical protein
MKSLFAKREPNLLTVLMVKYINSVLPTGMLCRETIGDGDAKSIIVFTNTKALAYEFNIADNYDVKELSGADKKHLDETVIIPALKQLDEEIRLIHTAIKERLKELESD